MKFFNALAALYLENLYVRFFVILFVSLIAAAVAKLFLKKVLKPLTKKTKTKVDDLIIRNLSSSVFYIVVFIGLRIGLQHFELKARIFQSLVDTVLIVILSVFLFKIIHSFSRQWMSEWKNKTKTTADERLIPFFEKVAKSIVIILAVIFIFHSWKVNISPLLATAGIAGLAIGFAVKDSLANIFGGMQLVLDKTFKVGDKVQLESGELGVIHDIGLRSTKLRTYDNEVIYIPNGYLANSKIRNFTQPDATIRVNVEFGVVYGSKTEKVRQVVLEAVKKIDTVLKEPEPIVQFLKMSDFSLDFVARAWVNNYGDAFSTQIRMTDEIYNALNEAGISIPFPTRTVYTKSVD